jgi:hypothetical protein
MIVVATPTRDSVTAGFAADLVKLCRRRLDVKFFAPIGIYISNLRQSAVRAAQQLAATHVLFIDSDMRFPDDTVDRLLAYNAPIIGANAVQRTMPELWTARKQGRSLSSIGRTGIEAVDSLGFGAMLIKLSVFDVLKRPWFSTPYEGDTHVGEDLTFCREASRAGFSIYVDHDLSQVVKHTGSIEWGVENAPDREAVPA